MHLNPLFGKLSWYIGVGGFFIFFMYRFRVLMDRSKRINEQGLIHKMENNADLNGNDYHLIRVILCGISSKKERINYLFIFVLSAITLVIALYMDFFM